MFDLIGIRKRLKGVCGSGGFYTQKIDVEKIVATFDSKDDARAYIKKARLKIPGGWIFDKHSILHNFESTTIRKSVYKPPPHNPTVEK